MDGWMDGWMDGHMYVCIYVYIHASQPYLSTYIYMDGKLSIYTYTHIYVCMYVCMYPLAEWGMAAQSRHRSKEPACRPRKS